MNKKSYYDVAMNDYMFFKNVIISRLDFPNYNAVVVNAQQIVEKLYKYIIDEFCNENDNTDALRSHKLVTLNEVIKNELQIQFLDKQDLRFLTDFYFDGRYPGNDYVLAELEDAKCAIDLVEQMVQIVHNFRKNHGLDDDIQS